MADDLQVSLKDGEYWFKQLILSKLETLYKGHEEMKAAHEKMHIENKIEMAQLKESIVSLRLDVNTLMPVRSVVYYGIGMILIAVMGALLGTVIIGKYSSPPTPAAQILTPDTKDKPLDIHKK